MRSLSCSCTEKGMGWPGVSGSRATQLPLTMFFR